MWVGTAPYPAPGTGLRADLSSLTRVCFAITDADVRGAVGDETGQSIAKEVHRILPDCRFHPVAGGRIFICRELWKIEMELSVIGEKKRPYLPSSLTATTASILSSKCFTPSFSIIQQLYYLADHVYGGRLPLHVHFVMDQFSVRRPAG